MEVKVQMHYDDGAEVRRWTPPERRFHAHQPPRVICTPAAVTLQISSPQSNRPDYSIRNKTKLIQLADRIQTNKRGSLNGIPERRVEDIVITSPTNSFLKNKRLPEDSIRVALEPSPLFQKVGTSFRRSKLYASFSPRKRSLQKLVKMDPAKTNIEHLVHQRTPSCITPQGRQVKIAGDALPKVVDTPQQVTTNPCFQDNIKLAAIFSGTTPTDAKTKNAKTHKNQHEVDGENRRNPESHAYSDVNSDNPGHRQLGSIHPNQISSSPSKKQVQLTWPHDGGEEEGSCHCEVDACVIPTRKGKDCLREDLVRNQEPRKRKEVTASVSHNSSPLLEERDENMRLINSSDQIPENRKRSCSLPRSFRTISKEVLRNAMIRPQQPNRFWNEIGSEKLKGIEERRMTPATYDASPVLPDIPTPSSSSPVKMRFEKQREGRPMSLDYGQRKAWLRAIVDMDAASNDPLSPPSSAKSSSKPKSKRPISITHLHLTESEDAEAREESPDTSSVGSSKSSTPSLFQRFSKTFSLRFGNSSPRDGKPPKSTRVPSGSSPDISQPHFESPRKVKRSVDPSSGKIRKRPINSQRGDKCQSGDSGIQLGEEEQRPVLLPTRQGSPDFRNPRHTGFSASMQKLSLLEIPRDPLDSDGEEREEDAGFVSANEEDGDTRVLKNGSSLPSAYFHSLPHKYSRQRKAELQQEKNASVRGNVVKELLTTEANYVKSLNDIVQGFVVPCRARSDLFNEKTVGNIFSNIEDILRFHARILESLQSTAIGDNLSGARIGHIFVDWADDFDLYSEYCYRNPMSVATVRQLSLNREYAEFFEACRRLQLMDKLPLHGFLLRPIQRICQYHLQLNELLKYTPVNHEDYANVNAALRTMKDVAMKVNDTQRKFDSLQEIVRIQAGVLDWEGPDLVPGSSTVLLKGDLIRTTHGHKPKEAHLVLLNNELLICRKDYYKKGTLSFNVRIPLCSWGWVDVNDDDEYFGAVQNSWRVFNPSETKWILLTAPSPNEKRKWMDAFQNSQNLYPVDPKMSEMAKLTALKVMLTESQSQQNIGSGLYFPSTSTLPRLRKNRKNSSLTKSDSDAMLIEVGKLRKSSHFPQSQNQTHHGMGNGIGDNVRPNSKFYV